MKIIATLFSGLLFATTAVAADLDWQQLVHRSELWPAHCTLKRGFDFQSGASVKAGDTVDVLAIHANTIEVGTTDGKLSFEVKPADTDALEAARTAYGSLTPKQQALTYDAIFRNHDLWPYYLTSQSAFDLGGGKRVNKGDQVVFEGIEGGKILVGSEKLGTQFTVAPTDTDLMAQARQFVEAKEGAPSRLIAQLQGKLIGSTTGQSEALNTNTPIKYLVFMRASNTCPITQKFMPSLVKFYDETKPKHPEFEIIYLSCDATAADMEAFAKKEGFSWPAVSYERSGYLSMVMPHFGSPIPQLTVMDTKGKVLISGAQAQAPVALQQFATLLDKPAVAE